MSTSAPSLHILIAGSGIAGPCLAFWLHRFQPSSQITILERSPELRLGGQAIDLRSAAVPIVERMGLLGKVREKTTTEVGMEFVYADGKTKATFPASGNAEQQSMTSEFEILRGDMAKLLYDETKHLESVKYVFDEMIIAVEEKDSGKIEVTFQNSLPRLEFDLVVGADGMMSRTRRLVFGHGPKNDDYLYRLGQYSALFTMQRTEEDTKFAQWYNAPKGRLVLLRPDQYGTTRAYISVTDGNLSRFDEIDRLLQEGTREQQQAWFEREFQGAGWQTDRVMRGMKEADDYYIQQIAQVRMDTWVKGHVALVGDAAYCPSPISGVGTGAAIVGAYVLAGEISKSPTDIPYALSQYEKVARPFVDKVQKLVPGTPQIANPQTEWGIKLFNTVAGVLSHPFAKRFGSIVYSWIPAMGPTTIWSPPEYGRAET
ncbi:FAD/NAD(P)-binding domain-containing protein [Cucurbitaria berberidis CBS 394.84]|uniref:FAD/NAD(P)-binding domain-containing protein n=1 Tax=Cucurbitaria berberidis CBS 394.84 TaxID=1168544 RepID=A0A9P4GCC1_9PLEO|nr:FAD/NAD(P)-binding domain-containing protein [Cucurbitaria berberidis CBS 394.84]KAF1843268.1 FAD/NAD(P)-binding domain-containing protein [Cucurbitaria berberidis CBS 394.84]